MAQRERLSVCLSLTFLALGAPQNWWGARRSPVERPVSRQPACKPGSVGRKANRALRATAIPLERRLPGVSSNLPGRPIRTSIRGLLPVPPLFGLAPGGVCRAASVAGGAVRSCRTVSPLPRDFHPEAVCVFCGTFPGVTPAGRYPAPHVHGARTFLPGELSVLAGAAVRPTDRLGMGTRPGPVKSRGLAGAPLARACGRRGDPAWELPQSPFGRSAQSEKSLFFGGINLGCG